jgi:hypothetical protein
VQYRNSLVSLCVSTILAHQPATLEFVEPRLQLVDALAEFLVLLAQRVALVGDRRLRGELLASAGTVEFTETHLSSRGDGGRDGPLSLVER